MNKSKLAKHILLNRNCDNCARAGAGNIECYKVVHGKWTWYSVSKEEICDQWKKYERP